MKWTMPYPWRSRRDSVRRINMSSEPGNESFFCALRPIPRILSLRRRDCASQVQIGEPSRREMIRGAAAPNESGSGGGSVLLDVFIAAQFTEVRRFGLYRIWRSAGGSVV